MCRNYSAFEAGSSLRDPSWMVGNTGKEPSNLTVCAPLPLSPGARGAPVSLSAVAQALFICQGNALDTKGKIKGWLRSLQWGDLPRLCLMLSAARTAA